MRIVCAQSVTCGEEAFSTIGRVRVMPDRAIDPPSVAGADALIIRSKTPVTQALIRNTPLRFVGSATTGFDHLDTAALNAAHIAWAAAAGCNADSVAEYTVSALLHHAETTGRTLAGRRLGIVGAGRIGTRVARMARALDMDVLFHDPLRAAAEPEAEDWRRLGDMLSCCDAVSLHVPLTDDGPCPTRGMADHRFFSALKPGALFINTSRGEVVDEDALIYAVDRGAGLHAVLDVWCGEPDIRPDVRERVLLGTPHIAGYSLDGRVRGTDMIYRACCGFFECEARWSMDDALPAAGAETFSIRAENGDFEDLCRRAAGLFYDITEDDAALRSGPNDAAALANRFKTRRAQYPERREFSAVPLSLDNAGEDHVPRLKNMGFSIVNEPQ